MKIKRFETGPSRLPELRERSAYGKRHLVIAKLPEIGDTFRGFEVGQALCQLEAERWGNGSDAPLCLVCGRSKKALFGKVEQIEQEALANWQRAA